MLTLSVIITNYNGKNFLRQCLSSLYGLRSPFSFETIVVDNGSHDGSCMMVRTDFPQVRLSENSENLGFAGGNNIGIAMARGKYLLLLNSDTQVIENGLEKLVSFLDRHPEVAVVTARLVYPDLSDQGVARTFPTPINGLFGRRSLLTRLFPNNRYSKKYLVSHTHTSDEPFEIDWGSGACLMVRKKVIEEIGPLDERFFMYWEDADLCFRIKQRGWKIYCVPEAIVIHYEGKSAQGSSNNRLIIEFNKGVYRYYRKHHIRSPFHIMNFVAIFGLTVRTLVLLAANLSKERRANNAERNDTLYRES
ncbi:MAG: glycosyltransferase [candidate division Zixibacteria bacterium]|nr:glycosyltransferase [candidate division Zixibacteria bacterium]